MATSPLIELVPELCLNIADFLDNKSLGRLAQSCIQFRQDLSSVLKQRLWINNGLYHLLQEKDNEGAVYLIQNNLILSEEIYHIIVDGNLVQLDLAFRRLELDETEYKGRVQDNHELLKYLT